MPILLDKFKGTNNTANVKRLPDGFLRECVDFNIDSYGKLVQREGYSLEDSAEWSCIWSDKVRCFGVRNADLVEMSNDFTTTTLRSGVGYVSLSFTRCNDDYYFVGDSVTGRIKGDTLLSFGQKRVEQQPSVSSVSGGALLAGAYLIAITTLDDTGVESGTIAPIAYSLAEDNKGLHLGDFPPLRDLRSTYYAIYASTQNGSELYRQGVISVSTPEVILYDIDNSTTPLTSLGYDTAPFGQLVAYHYGHLFIASGARLYYSDKLRYDRWHPHNFYSYPSDITAIMPCESGLWVATEKSGFYWISGKTPRHAVDALGDFTQEWKHHAHLHKGSEQRIEAESINQPTYGWWATADEGLFLLLDGGQYDNKTWGFLGLPVIESCAGALIYHNDTVSYLSIITGAEVPSRSI